ncbi:hypothetical protein G6F32_015877 [Rhizopus arrhizus]|nr:hypothetical protein G6F32_015877 [Rhizopus arrhizus]
MGKNIVNVFAEPQWTVAHKGEGLPQFTVFAGRAGDRRPGGLGGMRHSARAHPGRGAAQHGQRGVPVRLPDALQLQDDVRPGNPPRRQRVRGRLRQVPPLLATVHAGKP